MIPEIRAALLFALALLGGCQRAQDRTVEELVERAIAAKGRDSKVEIDREKGSITVDIGGPILPSGWPTDVPVDPRARRATIEAESQRRRLLSISTAESIASLTGFYRAELAAKGWQVASVGAEPLRARKGALELAARFSAQGEGSRVEIEIRDEG